MTTGWRIASVAGVAALVTVALGVPLLLMLAPPYTALLVLRVDGPTLAALNAEQTQALAEQARAFVAGAPGAELPAVLADGRPAFDEDAVAHLADVAALLRGVRAATVAALIAAIAWAVVAYHARRWSELSFSLTASAWGVGVLITAAVAIALADFGWFFSAFHGLFFEAGTWQFPADALLISLFPEQFWSTSAAVWAAFSLAFGTGFGALGRWVRLRPSAQRMTSAR